ncbi:hypothetical protein FSARC_5046 [Fusarium sarcochroum]|uniref:Uncharacterized protein n=1 Tax=Fusarium sarcochroum TaxID=1208366 RepID=A0A8H4U0P0_9HYPO|nr:hypothetical protein FSARC_5046 [Fusarium sarcochroum]
MSEANMHPYKHLTEDDVEHFLRKGWLRVPKAIKEEYIDSWLKDLWTRIDYDEDDKSTWHTEYLHLPRHREVLAEEFAPDAWNKIIEICGGEDRIDPVRERYYGDAFIINFGTADKVEKEPVFRPQERTGWHTDDDWYRMFLDSSGNALTVIHVFTDIPDRGGGTCVCEDGIEGVVKYLYEHPEGLDPPISGRNCAHVQDCKQYSTVVAERGDVILLHGLLPHVASPNYLHYARVITNPHVSLHSPYNLNRPDGNYSLLEQVILRNLGRDSVPEYTPNRERQSWYPRNAGFKRAKAEVELERMIAAAKARGLDSNTVESIYLRKGTKEFEEFEKRNGFDREVNHDSGLLMEQHKLFSRLQGKTALITGASSGIGAATAILFARCGANVILTARRVDRLAQTKEQCLSMILDATGKQDADAVIAIEADMTIKSDVQDIRSKLDGRQIDILVNNAGMVRGREHAGDIADDDIEAMIQTNVIGLIRLTQIIVRQMKKHGSGTIINLGSIAGREAYAGVNAFSTSMMKELVNTSIRVCEIRPGMVETEFSVVRFRGDKARADNEYNGLVPLIFPTAQAAATISYRKPE